MKLKFASFFLLIILCTHAFSQEVSITEERFSNELSNLALLEINSVPDTAEIYIDDLYMGNTDTELPLPSTGPHRLKLIKPGYDSLLFNFTAYKNTGLTLDAVLKRQTGILRVNTTPENVRITADGISLIQGENSLPTGSYTVLISADGLETSVRTVRIYDGRAAELSVELSPSADTTETTAETPSEGSRYPFTSVKSGKPGLILCPGTTVLNTGELQFFTGLGYREEVFPFNAGLRVSPLSNLEICGLFRAFVSLSFSGDTAIGGNLSIKYNLTGSSHEGFNIAAMLTAGMMKAEENSSYQSMNSMSASVPLGFNLMFRDINAGLIIAPGLSGSFFLSGGTAVSSPAFKLLTPAGLFVDGADFRLGLSAEPDYIEFGYGFPALNGLRAAVEGGFRIPGSSSSLTVYCAIDFGAEAGSITAGGLEAGAALSFISF